MEKSVHQHRGRHRRLALRSIALPIVLMLLGTKTDALAQSGNLRVQNFRQAKVMLALLYAERPQTLYSDCRFGPTGLIDTQACGFVASFRHAQPTRIEWEHVVPAQAFGQSFVSWRQGHPACTRHNGQPYRGRRCATKVEPEYRRMEADLYNLVPEVDEVNRRRSNKAMGVVGVEAPLVTPAGSRILGRTFEPRDAVKGDVARIYLYMDGAYPTANIVSNRRRPLYLAWSAMDPVDAWECRRAWRIEGLQGNANPVVRGPCQQAGLWPGE